jgi:hypothetical protein
MILREKNTPIAMGRETRRDMPSTFSAKVEMDPSSLIIAMPSIATGRQDSPIVDI